MAEIKSRSCCHCFETITPLAKVCPHCSRAQNRAINVLSHSDLIASLIAIVMVALAFMQLSQANDANLKAQDALERAKKAEARAVETCRAVIDVAQTIIQIADVIPRTDSGAAFQGGSLSSEDRAFLKTKQDFLRAQIRNSKC